MIKRSRITKTIIGIARLLSWLALSTVCLQQAGAQQPAQPGVVSGTVVDAVYGGIVSRAMVTVAETGQSAISDMNGKFLLPAIEPGVYTIVVSAEYYKSSRVEEVSVAAGEVARLDVPLYEDTSSVVELEEVTVKAQALAGSSIALLSERQKATSISDAIGSESFSRLGISDASDALAKTTGASIVDGKYVVIRGLSDRYNQATLNGSTVPSADPDKRAVQLDQFPAGIIESIVTSKSFTPDKHGSFTGGAVDVVTKSVPESAFLSLTFGVEYNENVTFDQYLASPGGDEDWLGFDDGTREIPSLVQETENIPSTPAGQSQETLELMDDIVRSFTPNLAPVAEDAPLNQSFSAAFGNRYYLGETGDGPVLGVVGSFNYKRSVTGYDDGEVGRYELVGRDLRLGVAQRFQETKGVDEAQWGAILNSALMLSGNHEIGLKTLYNQSGQDEAVFREGAFPEAVADDTFKVRNLHYIERTLSSYQAYGEHRLEHLLGARLEWEASSSNSVQEEPDFRLFYDTEPASPIGTPTFTGNFPPPRRYWRDLEETTDELSLDIALPFGERSNELKFGINNTNTSRQFEERSFIYQDATAIPYDGDASDFLGEDKIGLSESGRMQRYIREFIGIVPRYTGDQEVNAAYLMADLRPLERWRAVFGARLEQSDTRVQSFQASGEPFANDGERRNEDWLPSVQVVRELTPNQNLRLSYSTTLARPNFRELSPFGSFDNVGGEVFIGNPDLERTLIDNYDLRYEWFMEGSDLLAVSVFQKKLENPIELNYVEGQLTYINVPQGEVRGLEFEARKVLPFLSGEDMEFSVGGNMSVIESEVDRSEQELGDKLRRNPNASPTRELQGQSDLIANFDVLLNMYKWGSSFSAVYNHTGERLYSVSDSALPDIYEQPSDSLDFIYTQRLPNGFNMKLAIKNILDDRKTRVWSDFEEDLIYSDYGSGRAISLSFSKRFD